MRVRGALLALVLAAACARAPEDATLALDRGRNALAEQRFDLARVYFGQVLGRHPSDTAALEGACVAWSSGAQPGLLQTVDTCRRWLDARDALAPPPKAGGAAAGNEGTVADSAWDDSAWDDVVTRAVLALARSGDRVQALRMSARVRDPRTQAVLRAELWVEAAPESALEALRPWLSSDDDAHIHRLAAQASLALGRDVAADGHFQRAREIDPLAARSYYQQSRIAQRAGDKARAALERARFAALERYKRVLGPEAPSDVERLRILNSLDRQFPRRHPRVRLARARLELRAGFVDRAVARIKVLDARHQITPEQRLELADLLLAHGRYGLPRAWLEPQLVADPGNRHARTSYAALLIDLHALPAARAVLEEGLTREPFLARYHDLMARALPARDTAAREHQLRRALGLSPWNDDLRQRLAALLTARGRAHEAARLLAAAP